MVDYLFRYIPVIEITVVVLVQDSGFLYTWGGMSDTPNTDSLDTNIPPKMPKNHHRGFLGLGDNQGRLLPTLWVFHLESLDKHSTICDHSYNTCNSRLVLEIEITFTRLWKHPFQDVSPLSPNSWICIHILILYSPYQGENWDRT